MGVQHAVWNRLPVWACLFLAGCQLGGDAFYEESVGHRQQESVGGEPALDNDVLHHAAVATIEVLLPLQGGVDPNNERKDKRYCTGVLIEERTVLTAAGCLYLNWEAEVDDTRPSCEEPRCKYLDSESVKIGFGDGHPGTYQIEPLENDGLTLHRYYDPGVVGKNDLALLRLTEAPGIKPVTIHRSPLTQVVGRELELVGYGKNDDAPEPVTSLTARNVVSPKISSVDAMVVTAGTATATTCYADSGGPGFMDFGSGPELVTVTTLHPRNDGCRPSVPRQRVDVYADEFLWPFINRFSGPCAKDDVCATDADSAACDEYFPDPDCADNVCLFNGECKEDCDTRDWDCELGKFAGEACTSPGECEHGGTCVPAADDSAFTYCSTPCVAEESGSCPSSMSCQEGVCVYQSPSPGSVGASCTSVGDCRSGFCENLVCAATCDPADANACSDGLQCLPSLGGSDATVCRDVDQSGGGGFCAVVPGGLDRGRGAFLFTLLLLLAGAGILRRRARNVQQVR